MSDSFVTPWTAAHQASLSMGFPRQEYWSGLPCPLPGDLPDAGIDPCLLCLLHWQADSLPLHHLGHQRAVLNVHREAWPGCRQSQQQGLEDGWGAPLPASPRLPGVCFAVAAGAWKPGGLGSGLLINGRPRQVQSCGHCPGLRQPLGSVGLLGPWCPLFSWLCPHQARSLALRRASRVLWGHSGGEKQQGTFITLAAGRSRSLMDAWAARQCTCQLCPHFTGENVKSREAAECTCGSSEVTR